MAIAVCVASEPSRSSKKIPAFNYQGGKEVYYLGFKPETNPARRLNPDLVERYAYSSLADRETWFRVTNERMLAQQYREHGTPVGHQLRDTLTYIPFTLEVDE